MLVMMANLVNLLLTAPLDFSTSDARRWLRSALAGPSRHRLKVGADPMVAHAPFSCCSLAQRSALPVVESSASARPVEAEPRGTRAAGKQGGRGQLADDFGAWHGLVFSLWCDERRACGRARRHAEQRQRRKAIDGLVLALLPPYHTARASLTPPTTYNLRSLSTKVQVTFCRLLRTLGVCSSLISPTTTLPRPPIRKDFRQDVSIRKME